MPFSPAVLADNAAARLAGLLDSAMDAIITVDATQSIVLYNRAAEQIFGWPAAEMIGQPLARLLPERFQASHGAHVERFGKTGVTSRRMGMRSVVHGRRATGEEFPVEASISQIDTPEGKLYTVILRDVTERMHAEQEQSRLAARLAGLLDSAMDGIITVDEAQRIVLYNRAAERIFGWPVSVVVGRTLDMLMPSRFRSTHRDYVGRFARTGVTSRRMGDGTVIYGQRASGEEFPMDASISQVTTAEGRLFTVILRDVTERVRAQEELATLATEANAVREQEKTRVARELHDELAQSLTALKMDTIWVRDNVAAQPAEAAAKLAGMVEMIDGSVAATRRIAADLRPLVLDDLGLVAAIEWVADNFTRRTGVPCALNLDESLDLGEPHATAVFRLVQESLANVGKHASAQRVEVGLRVDAGDIELWVQDDGRGFDTAAARKPNSMGLAGLRERAQLLKGTIEITSAPGHGTRVRAHIPLVSPMGGPTA